MSTYENSDGHCSVLPDIAISGILITEKPIGYKSHTSSRELSLPISELNVDEATKSDRRVYLLGWPPERLIKRLSYYLAEMSTEPLFKIRNMIIKNVKRGLRIYYLKAVRGSTKEREETRALWILETMDAQEIKQCKVGLLVPPSLWDNLNSLFLFVDEDIINTSKGIVRGLPNFGSVITTFTVRRGDRSKRFFVFLSAVFESMIVYREDLSKSSNNLLNSREYVKGVSRSTQLTSRVIEIPESTLIRSATFLKSLGNVYFVTREGNLKEVNVDSPHRVSDVYSSVIAVGPLNNKLALVTSDERLVVLDPIAKKVIREARVHDNDIKIPFDPYKDNIFTVIEELPEINNIKAIMMRSLERGYAEVIALDGKRVWRAGCGAIGGPLFWKRPMIAYAHEDVVYGAYLDKIYEEKFCDDDYPISCSEELFRVQDATIFLRDLWTDKKVVAAKSPEKVYLRTENELFEIGLPSEPVTFGVIDSGPLTLASFFEDVVHVERFKKEGKEMTNERVRLVLEDRVDPNGSDERVFVYSPEPSTIIASYPTLRKIVLYYIP